MKRVFRLAALVSMLPTGGCSRGSDHAQTAQARPSADVVALAPDQLPWQKIDRGSLMAKLYGDPAKEGYYLVRYQLPPHWEAPPHLHGSPMIMTIHSGTVYVAYGADATRSAAKPFGPGSFLSFPTDTRMLEFTGDEGAVVDIQGPGPLITH